MAAAAMLESHWRCISDLSRPILLKFGTQTFKHMLSPKSAKVDLHCFFTSRWPTSICWKLITSCRRSSLCTVLLELAVWGNLSSLRLIQEVPW
jgi:hypothetical protein